MNMTEKTEIEKLFGTEIAAAIRLLAGEEISAMTANAIHSIIEGMPYVNAYSYMKGYGAQSVLFAGHMYIANSDEEPNDARPIFDCVKGWL